MATSVDSTQSSSKVNTSQLISSLGAGSGMDIRALAENLVEAEKSPRADRIQQKIDTVEARISGYGAMKFALAELSSAFKKVDDARDFIASKVTSSQPTLVSASITGQALPGNHTIEVSQIAKSTRWTSSGDYSDADQSLNGGNDLTLSFSVGNYSNNLFTPDVTRAFDITVSSPTPNNIVQAINSKVADSGISASVIFTGDRYKIVLSGPTGSDEHFTVSSDSADFSTLANPSQYAQDAVLSVNGLTVSRSSNLITDLLDGVSLNLSGVTTTAATLDITSDSTVIKENLRKLVSSYNAFNDSMKVLADRNSEVEGFGGALAGDSLLRQIRNQLRSLITESHVIYKDPTDTSTSPLNANIQAGWQIGLSFDRFGTMLLDEDKLDSALSTYPQEVSTFFSAAQNDKSTLSTSEAGLAGDVVKQIDQFLRSTGSIQDSLESAQRQLLFHQKAMEDLNEKMTRLLERYMSQFSLMEGIVGSSNSLRSSLSSTFDGMMSAYTRK